MFFFTKKSAIYGFICGLWNYYIFLMCEASFENFCMILVWVLRNHTNHIWPSMITKNFFSFFCFFTEKSAIYGFICGLWNSLHFLMCEASFENFCMILVWVLRNHTNHIWPSMITKNFFSFFLFFFYRKNCHIWFYLWVVKLTTFF